MSSFVLTDDYDIDITKGLMSLNTTYEALRQHLEVKFQIFLNEWFLDTTVGVPYFEEIFVKQSNFIVVQQILKEVISTTDGVNTITRFDFDYEPTSRLASLSFEVDTIYGLITVDQAIEV